MTNCWNGKNFLQADLPLFWKVLENRKSTIVEEFAKMNTMII